MIKLADYLQGCSPNWVAERLHREMVFKACFPKTTFNWQLLKDTSSALLKLIRQFLLAEELGVNTELEHTLVIKGAMRNGMEEVWKRQLRLFEDSKGFSTLLTPNHLLILEQYKNITLNSQKRSEAFQILERQVDGLDYWYWKERLRLTVEMLSVAQVLRQEINKEKIISLSSVPSGFAQYSAIVPYYLILQLLQSKYPASSTFFYQILALLRANNFPDSTEQEIYSFYVYGLNYCTAQINAGNDSYYKSLFHIFELLEQHGRLIQNERLSQWTFLNVIATACNLRKFGWATDFIQQYHTYIPIRHRQNTFHYCSALLHFYQKQYDTAVEHLLEVSGGDDPYYELNGRILQLRIFFEKQEWLLVESLMERLRIYLLRNKTLAPKRRIETQQFLKKARRLMLLIQSDMSRNKTYGNFIKALDVEQSILHRSWLVSMAEREMQ